MMMYTTVSLELTQLDFFDKLFFQNFDRISKFVNIEGDKIHSPKAEVKANKWGGLYRSVTGCIQLLATL